MGKFTPIASFVVQFSQPDLHRLASGDIDIGPLFQTTDRDMLAADPVPLMRHGIEALLTDACVRTTDMTRAAMIVNTMTFSWQAANGTSRRIRTATHLLQALEHGIANNISDLVLFAHCDLLYYNHTFDGLNLDGIDTTPFAPVTQPIVAPTTSTPASTPLPLTPPTDVFNYHALPSDVLQRYDSFQDPTVILRVKELTPFVDSLGISNFYTNPYVIGSRVILQNGAVLEGTPDQKLFSKDPPTCTGDTPTIIRSWYHSFTNHALSCGYFVVPYELLSKTNGGSNGFSFGTDLPSAKTPSYYRWQNDIGRLLKRSSAFPANSQSAKRAATTDNGYHLLLALVSDSHPAYVDQPILLAMHWPKQSPNQDIFGFYNDFIDNIRLRSIFLDGSDDMKSSHMNDCFIQSCNHLTYLTQVSRFDRKDQNKSHLFTPGNLAITLTNYLANSDSPLKKIPHFDRQPHLPPPNGQKNRNPYHRQIRSLLGDTIPDPNTDPSLTPTQLDLHHELVINQLRSHDPGAAPICAICKTETHRFNDCPLLNDATFLKGFAIRMCTTVSKELRTAKNRLANPTKAQIHAIEAHIHSILTDSSTPTPSDFQKGEN